ncbi:MADS-box protein FLOWERING LOCUS C-like [Hibiscus syriacus]|uniref:MADS-box protein FLOWERING LOCUS C-like n=1 Tax=Hibiscus syriacus TaxID=106335 RepID=UPI0019211205|nr:MADS-box protein FLOWERING LOCUS C-like [Hibiscus syriacus]
MFSSTGLLHQFCTAQSLRKILDRYVLHVEGEAAICNIANEAKTHDELVDIREGGSLLEMVERKLEGQFIEFLNITQLIQLENHLYSLLRETGNRKTRVVMDNVAAMKEKEKQVRQENDAMEKKIAARMDAEDGERVNQGSHYNSPQASLWNGLLHLF